MSQKIKPIRDLYFRFIKGTPLDKYINSQQAAKALSDARLIELLPHPDEPSFTHYIDTSAMKSSKEPDIGAYEVITDWALENELGPTTQGMCSDCKEHCEFNLNGESNCCGASNLMEAEYENIER